jgi:putative ATP-dependent endonuclease of OLD family
MKIARLKISNLRGIKKAKLYFDGHTVIVGDNNVGKSTILEAIDLTLGPDRLSKYPVIDEHDFFAGEYLDADNKPIPIEIETTIVDLNEEQLRHFGNNIEWWDSTLQVILESPPAARTDEDGISPALRICFKGQYDVDDDDFAGQTFFCSPQLDNGELNSFSKYDKRKCGFIYLRTLRTGARALSLERGSLLDIILKLREIRPQMWEDILGQLQDVTVAEKPELGVSDVLTSIQTAVQEIVPIEWVENPKLKVSDLTREHLRRILTMFIGTGVKTSTGEDYSAPFQHQGTGTINALVLVLLSMIAEIKQNVIFAMEEPEIAIPPYTQKQIINSITGKSHQAIFTSHSPYVLEEFKPSQILVLKRDKTGVLSGVNAYYPVKPKLYKDDFRKRFCEGLLARRVLITEGRTEYDSFPACARRLHKIDPENHKSFDGLGVAVINAEGEKDIAPIGQFYKKLGKKVFAVFDKQTPECLTAIAAEVDHYFEAQEKGFENVVVKGVPIEVLKRYAISLDSNGEWPTHYDVTPAEDSTDEEIKTMMAKFFKYKKGSGEAASFLSSCQRKEEMPVFIVETIKSIKDTIEAK